MRIDDVMPGIEYAWRSHKWANAQKVRVTSPERTIRRIGHTYSAPKALNAMGWKDDEGWTPVDGGVLPRELDSTWEDHVERQRRNEERHNIRHNAFVTAKELVQKEHDGDICRLLVNGVVVLEARGDLVSPQWAKTVTARALSIAIDAVAEGLIRDEKGVSP